MQPWFALLASEFGHDTEEAINDAGDERLTTCDAIASKMMGFPSTSSSSTWRQVADFMASIKTRISS